MNTNILHNRELSFDFCYSYFLKTKGKDNKRRSCLELGYYLASWGMLRGSSNLATKNLKYYEKIIDIIKIEDLWQIDVCDCDSDELDRIINVANKLKEAMQDINVTDTLLTKIMLGIWGCVPAYDRYVRLGYKKLTGKPLGKFDKNSLQKIQEFYMTHKILVDNYAANSNLIDYETEEKQDVKYPKAKIIDSILFKGNIENYALK